MRCGMPALGCAESGRCVTDAMRSTISSALWGPTPQFVPMTSTPSESSASATPSGVWPEGVSSSPVKLTCATRGRSQTSCTAANRLRDLLDTEKGFQYEEVDSALD